MEKITTKEELTERLEDIRAVEFLARKSYIEDIEKFSNTSLKDIISKIKLDEDKHIELLDELLNMLKR